MKKSVLITDLDNTLFDWVHVWHSSFTAMLKSVVEKTSLDVELLKSEIRQVHQRHGTSEYTFLLQEVPSLQPFLNGASASEVFADAISAFRSARSDSLVLYPTVRDTLEHVKDGGALVIAYTESMAFYTGYRLRKLNLDGMIDFLFSPRDHDIPSNMSLEQVRKYPSDHYEF